MESLWDVRNVATLATFVSLGCLGVHFLLRSKVSMKGKGGEGPSLPHGLL